MQQSRNDELVGKIFVALSQDMRRCLICGGVFTTQGAAAHAGTICHPSEGILGSEETNVRSHSKSGEIPVALI
jgi:hypothetical protein